MLETINQYLMGAILPAALLLSGIFFWIKLQFLPLRRLVPFIKSMRKNGKESFSALALSLGGTLGVGNIVGVSSAIYSGGFGAMFWMWVSALLASVLKYAEIILAMKHRVPTQHGFDGGAPYYIKDTLKKRVPLLSKPMSLLFAFLCVLNCLFMGGLLQTNAISGGLCSVFGISPLLCGLLLAFAMLILFFGGAPLISKVTSLLVPLMSIFYIVISLAAIIPRADRLPYIFSQIMASAFNFKSAAGGLLGFFLSNAVRFGVSRGLFSNEAGCGTSPTAHAASKCDPVRQGFMGIIEVFVDTVILCTLTGLVVMLMYDEASKFGMSPIRMTLQAYSSAFGGKTGEFAEGALTLSVALFGFATLCCLIHYGLECTRFISKKRAARPIFVAAYMFCIAWGALVKPHLAWEISDLVIGSMTVINLAILWLSRKEIAEETLLYLKKSQKK